VESARRTWVRTWHRRLRLFFNRRLLYGAGIIYKINNNFWKEKRKKTEGCYGTDHSVLAHRPMSIVHRATAFSADDCRGPAWETDIN